mgnify:CR=1 FL=1
MDPRFLAPASWSFALDHVELWLLVVTRFAGLLAALPALGQERVPLTVRAALAALSATVMAPVIPRPAALPSSVWDMAATLVLEFLAGLLLGLVVAWIFEAIAFAGVLMDIQMGFSFVQIMDPSSGGSAAISGTLLMQIAVLVMFATGLHHQMILALVESYRLVPIGSGLPVHPQEVVVMSGQLLLRGLQLSMPILLTLFIVDVLEGIAAKVLPQLQLIQLAFPLKIGIGTAVFIVLLRELNVWLLPLFQKAPEAALRLLS